MRALEHAQRRVGAGGGADLGGERGVAQNARRLVVVARGRRHVDAQQDLAPAVEHVPEQMCHLQPQPNPKFKAETKISKYSLSLGSPCMRSLQRTQSPRCLSDARAHAGTGQGERDQAPCYSQTLL